MKYLIIIVLLSTLNACSTLPTQSNPLASEWTQHQDKDLVSVRHEQQGDVLIRHYHVFNAPAQLASLHGFTQTSAQQRQAELNRLCNETSAPHQHDATTVRYEYYWGSHENHPLLSAFNIEPDVDCPS